MSIASTRSAGASSGGGPSERLKCQLESEAAASVAAGVSRSNVLRFSLVRQVIWGELAGKPYGPVAAFSGGGQDGVTQAGVRYVDWKPSNKAGAKAGQRGGALVPGWWIAVPERLDRGEQLAGLSWGGAPTANSVRLLPYKLEAAYSSGQRNSFYIHGTGGGGSDGCLLVDPANRQVLVTRILKAGGAWLHAYISKAELDEARDRWQATAHIA